MKPGTRKLCSIPLDLADLRDPLLGRGGAEIAQGRFEIRVSGVGHDGSGIDLAAKPGRDAGTAELVQLELFTSTLAFDFGEAVGTPSAFDLCAACQALDHDEEFSIRIPFGVRHNEVLIRVLLFPFLQLAQEICGDRNVSLLIVLHRELVIRLAADTKDRLVPADVGKLGKLHLLVTQTEFKREIADHALVGFGRPEQATQLGGRVDGGQLLIELGLWRKDVRVDSGSAQHGLQALALVRLERPSSRSFASKVTMLSRVTSAT